MRKNLLIYAVLLVLAAAPAALAQIPASPRLETYTIRPGDTLEDLAESHLGDHRLWPELQRLNPEIKDPYKLKIGSTMKIPVPDTTGTALLTQVVRKVEKKPEPAPWVPAQLGDHLQEKHGVRTGERSSAELKFRDGANLVLTENSLVFLQKLDRPVRGPRKDVIEIVDGQADLAAKKATKRNTSGDVEVIVGTATVHASEPKSGENRIRSRSAADKKAQVMVYGGAGEVESAGVKVPVSKGMGTVVEQGKAPEKPVKLLAAPATVAPARGAKVKGPARLQWKPVTGATAYTAELCSDAECTKLVARATGLTSMEWTPPDDSFAGPYFWRVTASGADGLDGFPSATVPFTLMLTARGRVVEDRAGDGGVEGDPGIASASVVLYADGGDGVADGRDDVKIGETKTDASGSFAFSDFARAGIKLYWLVVPASSVRPAGVAADAPVMAEQTVCSGGGALRAWTVEGNDAACYGGRAPDSADAAGSLAGAKHVIAVDSSAAGSPEKIFGFSFNVVTNVNDAGQGSLRQFLVNASAIPGEHRMRFAPPPAPDKQPRVLRLASPLPALGSGVVVDGSAGGPAPALSIDASAVAAQSALVLAGGATAREVVVSGAGSGVTLSGSGNLVEGVELVDNGWGVELTETARNNEIRGCTFRGNAKAGIADDARPQGMPEPRGNRFSRNVFVVGGGPAIYMPSWGDTARPEAARRPCVAGWPVTVPPVLSGVQAKADGELVVTGASCAGANVEVYGFNAETRTFSFAGEAQAGSDGRFTVSLASGSGSLFAAIATTAAGTSAPSGVVGVGR